MARTMGGDKLEINQPVRHPRHQGFSVCSSLPFSKKKAVGTNLTIRMQAKALNYFTFPTVQTKTRNKFPTLVYRAHWRVRLVIKPYYFWSVTQNCSERTIKSNTNTIVKILPLLVPVASKIAWMALPALARFSKKNKLIQTYEQGCLLLKEN